MASDDKQHTIRIVIGGIDASPSTAADEILNTRPHHNEDRERISAAEVAEAVQILLSRTETG